MTKMSKKTPPPTQPHFTRVLDPQTLQDVTGGNPPPAGSTIAITYGGSVVTTIPKDRGSPG